MTLSRARLCLLVVLTGCQSSAIVPSAGLGDPYPAPLNDPQYNVLSPELQQWIRFHPARVDATEGKPLQVEVPVRNLADRQYLVDYRVLFYDANDLELEPVMGWRFAALEPKQVARLKAGALSTGAVNFRLELKWAR